MTEKISPFITFDIPNLGPMSLGMMLRFDWKRGEVTISGFNKDEQVKIFEIVQTMPAMPVFMEKLK